MSDLRTGFLSRGASCSRKSRHFAREKKRSAVALWALCAVLAPLMTFGCGTTHATLDFTAPSTAIAGSPFTVTVTVMIGEKRDTVINSSVHFTSSDPAAVLPGDYYFTPSDAGSHTWSNGFILTTPGSQTISGEIIGARGINGNVAITVSATTIAGNSS